LDPSLSRHVGIFCLLQHKIEKRLPYFRGDKIKPATLLRNILQVIADGQTSLPNWDRSRVNKFVKSTCNKFVTLDAQKFLHRVNIFLLGPKPTKSSGLLRTKTLVYSTVHVGHYHTAVVASYLELMEKLNNNIPQNGSNWDVNLFPKMDGEATDIEYKGGAVYSLSMAAPDGCPDLLRSKTPKQNLELVEMIKEEISPIVFDEAANVYGNSLDKPQSMATTAGTLLGDPSNAIYDQHVPVLGPYTDDYLLQFIRKPISHLVMSGAGMIINYMMDGTHAGEAIPIKINIPKFSAPECLDVTMLMDMPDGGGADTGEDPTMGNILGSKTEHCLTAKKLLQATMLELQRQFDNLMEKNCGLVGIDDYIKKIWEFFQDPKWDGFILNWIKIFEKAEVIKVTKATRLIWAAALVCVVLDKLVYKKMHLSHKLWHSHGWTHGFSPKGGGMQHLLDEAVDFFMDRMENMDADFITWMCDKMGVPMDEDFGRRIKDFVTSSLLTSDDDIKNWDVGIKVIDFIWFDAAVLFAYGYPDTKNDKDFFFLMALMCLANMNASTKYVKMKTNETEEPRFCAIIRGIASGMFNTAHMGSAVHAYIRVVRCTYLGMVLNHLRNRVINLRILQLIDYALMGQIEYHHSDDFLSFIPKPIAPLLAICDSTSFYADYFNLALKFEAATSENVPLDFQGMDIDYFSYMCPKFVKDNKLDLGTTEGVLVKDERLLSDITLYDYPKRLQAQFHSVFSKFAYDDKNPEGRLTRQGLQFLQYYLLYVPEREQIAGTAVLPVRGVTRLIAKLMRNADKELTDAEWLMKLINFGFLACGNRPLHAKLERIFDKYKKMKFGKKDISVELIGAYRRKRVRTNFEFDDADCLKFPDYNRVLTFHSLAEDKKFRIGAVITRQSHGNYPNFDYLKRKDDWHFSPQGDLRENVMDFISKAKQKSVQTDFGPQISYDIYMA